jgi:hypothetical protein
MIRASAVIGLGAKHGVRESGQVIRQICRLAACQRLAGYIGQVLAAQFASFPPGKAAVNRVIGHRQVRRPVPARLLDGAGMAESAGTITVRRSVGIVRNAGEGAETVEGRTKTDKPRMIDIDPGTVAVLESWKRERGGLALALARDDSLVFGDLEGRHRHPERFSRLWNQTVCRAIRDGVGVTEIRLHDLRHSHATILLLFGVPVHVVSQRLGHASPVVTMTVYAHVLPGSQREAANLFARKIGEVA